MATQKDKPLDKDALKNPDEFLVLNTKLMTWVLEHKLIFGGIIGVIIIIGLIFSGIKYSGYVKEVNASELTASIVQTYVDNVRAGNDKAYEVAALEFEKLAAKYGNTKNGNYAKMTFANISYEAGQYETALKYYQQVLSYYSANPVLSSTIQSSIGYCYAAMEDYDNAAAAFQKVVDKPNGVLKADALYNMGVIYDKLNEPQRSKAVYDRIGQEFSDSLYAQLLKNRP